MPTERRVTGASCAGVVIVFLAVLHAAALFYWLYMLAKSRNMTTAWKQPGQVKKISMTYDLDPAPGQRPFRSFGAGAATANGQALGANKRNRSIPNLGAAASI